MNVTSLDAPCRNVRGDNRERQACCSATLDAYPIYHCPSGDHLTCRLHLYMDALFRPHCYTCMAELPESAPDIPLVSRRPRAIVGSRETAVIVIHALHMCGAARHCLELAQELHRDGFLVTILAIGGGGHWAHRFLEIADTVIIGSPSDTWTSFTDHLAEANVAFVTAHHDPAILWALNNAPSSIPVFAHFHIEPSSDASTAELLTTAVNRCVRVLFPSQHTLRQYQALIPQNTHHKLAVLPNSLPRSIAAEVNRLRWRRLIDRWQRGMRSRRSHLAIISRLDNDKFSIPLFVRALKLVVSEQPAVTVTIAGCGEIAADVQLAADEADLSPYLNFLGFVDDIGSLYRSADAVFVPSHTEAMPYTALESAAAGTPCVIPRLGYFADDAGAMAHVHVFDPGDYTTAASLIINALAVPPRRRRHRIPDRRVYDAWSEVVSAAYSLESR